MTFDEKWGKFRPLKKLAIISPFSLNKKKPKTPRPTVLGGTLDFGATCLINLYFLLLSAPFCTLFGLVRHLNSPGRGVGGPMGCNRTTRLSATLTQTGGDRARASEKLAGPLGNGPPTYSFTPAYLGLAGPRGAHLLGAGTRGLGLAEC